jgi:hypothetical protein
MEKGHGAEDGKKKKQSKKPSPRRGGVMQSIAKLLCFCGAPAEG